MSLASGHHRIMVAARGALVMMVLGKVEKVLLDHSSKSSVASGLTKKAAQTAMVCE
ncbi:hypothetical protein VFPPC_16231 [Pochonia chlamydosporia 170]|uniref:Uncharacterized protein n=1 Tax=Pochonia chlamydosporia 170 TaxID=1380566 RepID=A0A179FGA8_METCM|nr:hypothetical protein VFPPC_16231 [Pochonia chlamydosporia 170]OAQ64562.1 hypothetical protein VFPPC_16231 [Pochonia chlamydosporia 170]